MTYGYLEKDKCYCSSYSIAIFSLLTVTIGTIEPAWAINSEDMPCSALVLKLQEQTYIGEISVSLKKGIQYQLTLADAVSVFQIHRIQ
jgi:hypothetical protein